MDIKSSSANSGSRDIFDEALEQFEAFGNYWHERESHSAIGMMDAMSVPTGAADIGAAGLEFANHLTKGTVLDPVQEFGLLGKTMGHLGGLADGLTGVGELAEAFAKDRQGTDWASKHNVATLGKAIEVTGRISAASIAGTTACGVAAALTGATVLPVVIGIGAAVAASYAVSKAADGVRWVYGKIF